MEHSLSDRIAKRELTKKKSPKLKNKVAFLALKQDIQQAIHAGWPKKTIWETLIDEGKISFSYNTFRIYVAELLIDSDNLHELKVSSSKQRLGITETKKVANQTGIPSFTFQSKPNPEELF